MPVALAAISDITPHIPVVEIVEATHDHVRELARTMRAADKKEIENFGVSVDKGLWRSYRSAIWVKAALIDGEVAAIWGLGGIYLSDTGRPWMLSSPAILRVSPLRFARAYQQEVYKMLEMFPVLVNDVDDTYEGAKRLLTIVGFSLGEPRKLGNGMFREFEMRGSDGR